MGISIYTVADDRFFPGLMGLIASVRVHGHVGPIVVVDSGLTAAQLRSLVGRGSGHPIAWRSPVLLLQVHRPA